jgi:hypothetical protein
MKNGSNFALWFFHNSIRFKVNKDWIREFVRIPFFFFNNAVTNGLFENSIRYFILYLPRICCKSTGVVAPIRISIVSQFDL